MLESLIFALVVVVVPLLIYVGRTWIKQLIESGVKAEFDRELEGLKSDLRLKESQISTLQADALSGRAGRQALIDKRRLEAIEEVWKGTLKLNPLRADVSLLSSLDIEAASERAPNDAKFREFLKMMPGSNLKDSLAELRTEAQRPFVPVNLWATFSAYMSIVVFCHLRIEVLRIGAEDSAKLFNLNKTIEIAKAVMPDRSDYLDRYGVNGLAQIVEPLYDLVADTVRTSIAGAELDAESVTRSARIIALVHEVQKDAALAAA